MKKRTPNLRYVTGDATAPKGRGPKIIAHICNNVGAWGKGFVLAVSGRWPQAETAYKEWFESRASNDFAIGAVQFVQVEPKLWIANMIAQHDLRRIGNVPPIRYEYVEHCLYKVGAKAKELAASVHMPLIGCGLAGGKWDKIEPFIIAALCKHGISVTVYELP